jgi:hypothetical protein
MTEEYLFPLTEDEEKEYLFYFQYHNAPGASATIYYFDHEKFL